MFNVAALIHLQINFDWTQYIHMELTIITSLLMGG